ncbi:MAG: cupin domain-containing protein [Paracoccaceae bacterium]
MRFDKKWSDILPSKRSMGDRDWGSEDVLAVSANCLMMKRLFLKSGSKGGLQYHRKRVEAGFVVSGKLIIRLGLKRQIEERVLTAGDWFIFEPGVVHQEEAIEDTVIIECSTPWINDRVRVEKYYGIDSNEGLPSTEPGTEKLL